MFVFNCNHLMDKQMKLLKKNGLRKLMYNVVIIREKKFQKL